jgi:hypothetical protein
LPSTQGYFADPQGYRPPSNHRNHPSTSQGYFADTQGYRPDLSNLSRNNIDLNQGLPEHQVNDPIMNFNIDDYDLVFDDAPMMASRRIKASPINKATPIKVGGAVPVGGE